MKDAVSYLKLDLRISKRTLLTMLPILIIVLYLFFGRQMYYYGKGYLLLIQMIFVNTPFIAQGNENLEKLYYIFPAKVSKIVLGRFLYLILWCLCIFFMEIMLILYLFNINEVDNNEIAIMVLSEMVVLVVLFIQYPLSYKIGFDGKKTVLNIMGIVPAVSVIMLPDFLKRELMYLMNSILNNELILLTLGIIFLSILGYLSYLVSWRICIKKEV